MPKLNASLRPSVFRLNSSWATDPASLAGWSWSRFEWTTEGHEISAPVGFFRRRVGILRLCFLLVWALFLFVAGRAGLVVSGVKAWTLECDTNQRDYPVEGLLAALGTESKSHVSESLVALEVTSAGSAAISIDRHGFCFFSCSE